MFLLVITVLTVLIFIDSFPQNQERCHWFIILVIHVSITNFCVNYGFNLLIP